MDLDRLVRMMSLSEAEFREEMSFMCVCGVSLWCPVHGWTYPMGHG